MYLKQAINLGGRELTIETGRIAKQADGAVLVRQGETVVLVTAVSGHQPRAGADFFPLTVDYREYGYAAGRIPGGYFKREGRPTEKETLTMRLTDRPLRPLFPENYRHETQIISMVISADDEHDPDVLSITGASAALYLSDIPFETPVGGVRVGLVDGKYVVNPTYDQIRQSQLNLTVAGTEEAIVMVEAGAKEVSPRPASPRPVRALRRVRIMEGHPNSGGYENGSQAGRRCCTPRSLASQTSASRR